MSVAGRLRALEREIGGLPCASCGRPLYFVVEVGGSGPVDHEWPENPDGAGGVGS